MLPTVSIGGIEISRLTVGGNPFSGNSHYSIELNDEMINYFTMENIKRTLHRCEQLGMRSFVVRGDSQMFAMVREYRSEGGKMRWLAQHAPEFGNYEAGIHKIKQAGAELVYHQGTITDALFKEGNYKQIQENLKVIRDAGFPAVGLGTHMPHVLEFADSNGWDVDFYALSVYNLSRIDRVSSYASTSINIDEPFFYDFRAIAFKAIRETKKPCIAFKVLGAKRRCDSQEDVRAALEESFASIKPIDAVLVGMYPKYQDEPAININMVKDILGVTNSK
ncbi:MAG: hypothetical protein LBD23_03400 [Oscillospiraceae bacterium]|jgi:hypothetical protein|nr:hypothetical protein [Oscillospiraceae bacterium]